MIDKFLEDFSARWYKLFPYSMVECDDMHYQNAIVLKVSMFVRGNLWHYNKFIAQEVLSNYWDEHIEYTIKEVSQEFTKFITNN